MNNLVYGGSGIHENPTVFEKVLLGLAEAGDLATAVVMLFTDSIAYPVKDKAITDLHEATFAGYAVSAAVVWGAPFVDLAGNAVITAQKIQFLCTGPATPNVITGAAIVKADKSVVYAIDIFLDANGVPSPVTMEKNGDALDYVPALSFADRNNQ